MKYLLVLAAVLMLANCSSSAPQVNRSGPEPDLSSARAVALTFYRASVDADAEVLNEILVDDPNQREFVNGMLQFTVALRKLDAVAMDRFGRSVSGYPLPTAQEMERKLKVKLEGRCATVSAPGALLPLRLCFVDDRWRVDLSEAMNDPRLLNCLEAAREAAGVAEEVTAEIAAGKFDGAEAAEVAFRQRRLAAVGKK